MSAHPGRFPTHKQENSLLVRGPLVSAQRCNLNWHFSEAAECSNCVCVCVRVISQCEGGVGKTPHLADQAGADGVISTYVHLLANVFRKSS